MEYTRMIFLLMPSHLACESKKSSSLLPGRHEHLQSFSVSWGLLYLSVVDGKKSTSTVKAISNSVLPYRLGLLVISPGYNHSQAKVTVLQLHGLSFIVTPPYFFFTFSSLCLKCRSSSDKYLVILQTSPNCRLLYFPDTLKRSEGFPPSRPLYFDMYLPLYMSGLPVIRQAPSRSDFVLFIVGCLAFSTVSTKPNQNQHTVEINEWIEDVAPNAFFVHQSSKAVEIY